jgi:hypothetical protein
LLRGAGLAAVIGGGGLGLYYLAFRAGIGNMIMGAIVGTLVMRWRRTNPMIIAHTLINAVAFIGYTLLATHVPWLP